MVNTRICTRCGYIFQVGDNAMLYFDNWARCPNCKSMKTEHRSDLRHLINENEKGEFVRQFAGAI